MLKVSLFSGCRSLTDAEMRRKKQLPGGIFRLEGLRIQCLGFMGLRVQGLGFIGFRVQGLGLIGFRVQGLGFIGWRVQGLGIRGSEFHLVLQAAAVV